MFIHSRAVGTKIINDLNRFSDIYTIVIQILYILFLVYATAFAIGNQAANIILLVLSSSYLLFMVFMLFRKKILTRMQVRRAKHVYRISILAFRAVSLGIAIYGIHIALAKINTLSIVFASLMLIGWVSSVFFELIRFVFERYEALIAAALSKDTEPYVNFYKKITFQRTEAKGEPSKTEIYVDGIAKEYKKGLEEKKKSEKARRQAEAIIRKEAFKSKIIEKKDMIAQKVRKFFKRNKAEESSLPDIYESADANK